MTIELEKICKRFKINNLNRDDLSQYTNYLSKYKNGKEQLKTTITCVSNAEKTLEKFKDFLTTDKYKEWNREQGTTRQTNERRKFIQLNLRRRDRRRTGNLNKKKT